MRYNNYKVVEGIKPIYSYTFRQFNKGEGARNEREFEVNGELLPKVINLCILRMISFSVKVVFHKGTYVKDKMYAKINVKFEYLFFVNILMCQWHKYCLNAHIRPNDANIFFFHATFLERVYQWQINIGFMKNDLNCFKVQNIIDLLIIQFCTLV